MLYKKYMSQKYNAKKRGILFELTFNDWLQIWKESGKLNKRGSGSRHFVMGRKGDIGSYTVGNVYITTARSNIKYYYSLKRQKYLESQKKARKEKIKKMLSQIDLKKWKEAESKRQEKLKIREYFKQIYNAKLYPNKNHHIHHMLLRYKFNDKDSRARRREKA